jgi:3-oxoacyl-[acyl-carrier-protein] synthase II
MGQATVAGGPRRVVITGRGAITPVGLDWQATWEALGDGKSGIRALSSIDTTGLPVSIGGEIKGFTATEHLPRTLVRRSDTTAHLAMVATRQALRDAELEIDAELAPRTGVVIGSACGPTKLVVAASERLRDRGYAGLSPFFFATSSVDSPTADVALMFGIQGPSACMTTACATGATCIGESMRMIQHGTADVVVAGGVDDTITRLDLAAGARSTALSRRNDDPEGACRPFDRDRDGFVMSAGTGVLVLESAEHAERRGARILGELAGYGATTDAFHVTAPHPEGLTAQRAMRAALAEAGASPGDVGYVNAHGTGTKLNDSVEVAALRNVFGPGITAVPVSSTKSMTGHMLGASGAVEAIIALEVIRTGVVPPTINCDDPEDPELNYVAHQAQEHSVDLAMSNSFGFGGHNAVLVLRRWRR